MSNEDKSKELAEDWKRTYFVYEKCGGSGEDDSYEECYETAKEMAAWKDAQLDKAFEKALKHHQNKLKEGKITQYGMDNVFAFVENVRFCLAHDC